ncbi:hypothetical protein M422DRAFT_244854 [Sphaerobolus stellatus SS14]|nr:hypothetical protein M422DRAFT_244854 [Sphaerobolus stellatus SS14]
MPAFLAIETRRPSTPATHPRSVANTLINRRSCGRAVLGYGADIADLGYD